MARLRQPQQSPGSAPAPGGAPSCARAARPPRAGDRHRDRGGCQWASVAVGAGPVQCVGTRSPSPPLAWLSPSPLTVLLPPTLPLRVTSSFSHSFPLSLSLTPLPSPRSPPSLQGSEVWAQEQVAPVSQQRRSCDSPGAGGELRTDGREGPLCLLVLPWESWRPDSGGCQAAAAPGHPCPCRDAHTPPLTEPLQPQSVS